MCFGGGTPTASTPAPAPPAASPLAQAQTPLYGLQSETANLGYGSDGNPKLLRDPSVTAPGTGAGVAGASSGASGLGQM